VSRIGVNTSEPRGKSTNAKEQKGDRFQKREVRRKDTLANIRVKTVTETTNREGEGERRVEKKKKKKSNGVVERGRGGGQVPKIV